MVVMAHGMYKRTEGPCITNAKGQLLSTSTLDERLHNGLIQLFEEGTALPQEIKMADNIIERFSVFRSLRRASNTRAMNQKVAINDIDIINQWKSVEAAQGKRPSRPMRQHYAEVGNLVEPFLRYTYAM